jgi:hypothetical protein
VTLQIGLAGNDGNIVLASDRRMVEEINDCRAGSDVRKLLVSKDEKVSLCFAGNELAEKVARDAIATSGDDSSWPMIIKDAIDRHCKGDSGGEITRCSILSVGHGDLCSFRFTRTGLERFDPKVARAVGGDRGNPAATFFLDRYYNRFALEDLSIHALKRLATHSILLGGKLNPAFVEGLDMVVWHRETRKIERIERAEIIEFTKWSDSLDKATNRAFLGGLEIQFTS